APRFVVYTDQWIPGTDEPPTVAQLKGFNVLILSFLLLSGPADKALEFTELDAATRASIISAYHAAGISIMVSAFGSTDAPTSEGADPTATANTIAAFVKQYGLDGVDVDYEDFNAINSGTGSAETWLITFTKALRAQLPSGQYIITHAPVAPWFTTSTSLYPHGAYRAVNTGAGSSIDWYNLQFYNQGSDYTTCTTLLTASNSDFPHSSVFEISSQNSIALNKLVIGKPASSGDASSGYMSASTLAGCLKQAKSSGWNGGAMFWEYPDASASWIASVRTSSWPV
ncbi:glycoside hydrolase family 18 protein, partial [Sistotremastrum suecicum HHB10207 ss-3]